MNQLSLSNSPISDIQVIASSGPFQIELLKQVGENDYSLAKAVKEMGGYPHYVKDWMDTRTQLKGIQHSL